MILGTIRVLYRYTDAVILFLLDWSLIILDLKGARENIISNRLKIKALKTKRFL